MFGIAEQRTLRRCFRRWWGRRVRSSLPRLMGRGGHRPLPSLDQTKPAPPRDIQTPYLPSETLNVFLKFLFRTEVKIREISKNVERKNTIWWMISVAMINICVKLSLYFNFNLIKKQLPYIINVILLSVYRILSRYLKVRNHFGKVMIQSFKA